MSRTIFRDTNLLDGRKAAQPHSTIVVEGERITAVSQGQEPAAGPDDRVIDLAGRTLMPGMVSSHFHATFDGATLDIFPLAIDKPPGYMALRAANAMREALSSGFTSIVGAGGTENLDAQLKLAIEEGIALGPRIMACGHNLGTTSGYIDLENWWWELGNIGACRLADGPEEFRKLVREEIKRGAEMIKLFVTGGHGNLHTATSEFSRDELESVVRTAHERGAKVRAHCAWKAEILQCVELGVDVIDHGDELDGDCIAAMVEAGTFLDPSALFLEKLLGNADVQAAAPQELIDTTRAELDNLLRRVPEANAAGIPILLGDDYGTILMPHGTYAEELEFYVKRFGIPALDVLRWATVNGARLMGMEDELGSIEEGKLADLLVVDGDPSADIAVLGDREKILAIVKGGAFVKDALAP